LSHKCVSILWLNQGILDGYVFGLEIVSACSSCYGRNMASDGSTQYLQFF